MRAEEHSHNRAAAWIGDIVYGSHDGIITTFAIIAGSVGAALGATTVVILGVANVIADGISMAASSYLARKSEIQAFRFQQTIEEWETSHEPEEERREVRDILAAKGYHGEDLQRLTELITKNPKFWVDFMMSEELKIFGTKDAGRPIRTAVTTFASFVAAGMIPLAPYFTALGESATGLFPVAIAAALGALVIVGLVRSRVSAKKWYEACGEVVAVGIVAGGSAYAIGALLARTLGAL